MTARTIHALVTDIRMPEMDGQALLAWTEIHCPLTIRLVLSALAESDTILQAVNAGHIYRYIVKPWDNHELKITLRKALEIYELQEEKRVLLARLEQHNRMLEQQVEERTRELVKARAQAEIGKYASLIVHNLNNPLHALNGALDLVGLLMGKGAGVDLAKIAEIMNLAKMSAKDLQRIISSILVHSRQESSFHLERVDLNALIRQELTFFDLNPFFHKEIERKVHLAETEPTILGNTVQIKQILDNLIRNAIDAMEHSPVKRLTLKTSQVSDVAVLEVTDTGEGIAPGNLPRVFAPDFTTKPAGKGTGLGLASVKAMVDAYGGDIQVRSEKGRGASFTVRLPARRV